MIAVRGRRAARASRTRRHGQGAAAAALDQPQRRDGAHQPHDRPSQRRDRAAQELWARARSLRRGAGGRGRVRRARGAPCLRLCEG